MKRLIFYALLFLSFWSCRKDDAAFDGPDIREQYSEFRMLEPFVVNTDSVNFAGGELALFTAKFNKMVNWTITVTGETSHAVKLITGLSRAIDGGNGTWNGSTTTFPMFRQEKVTAVLKIENVTDTFSCALVVSQVKVNEGLVLADFETGFNPAWTKFVQTGANMDFNIKTDALAPQGAKYLNMAGTVNWDWLIGLIDFPASAYGGNTFPLPSNPNQVYFNCLIYGVAGTNQTLVLFQFKEDENGDGNIDPNKDDQYDLEIRVNWTGWKLVTVRYADLPSLSNGQPTTPKGNGQHNPDRIGKISMLDLADPANGFASCKIDYIIFTQSPLEP